MLDVPFSPDTDDALFSAAQDLIKANYAQKKSSRYYINRAVSFDTVPVSTGAIDISAAFAGAVVVYCDDSPEDNWPHTGRILIFDVANHKFLPLINSSIPPFYNTAEGIPETFVEFLNSTNNVSKDPTPETYDKRFAVLFCGKTNRVNFINEMEWMYRCLVLGYGFDPENVYVLNYDGTFNWTDGDPDNAKFPGKDTDYMIKDKISGSGTYSDLMNTLAVQIAPQITNDSQLFMYFSNHGDENPSRIYERDASETEYSYKGSRVGIGLINQHTMEGKNDFAITPAMLNSLLPGKAKTINIFTGTCYGGGFSGPMFHFISDRCNFTFTAKAPSWAVGLSHGEAIGPFELHWINALYGQDPDGNSVDASEFNVDAQVEGLRTLKMAYLYARAQDFTNINPSLVHNEGGRTVTLGPLATE